MAKITQLKRGSENVYPLVHMDGVVDDSGNSISTMWDTKQDKLVSGASLKTVNGTSLLGSGDIEVVSVDAGDINVLQSTGDSQVDVMSQKAVTEYGHRVTEGDMVTIDTLSQEARLPHGYDELDWIDNGPKGSGAIIDTLLVPNDANWRFVGSWCRTGLADSWLSVISAATNTNMNTYSIRRYQDHQVAVSAHQTLGSYTIVTFDNPNTDVWHHYDLRQGTITLDGVDTTLGSTTNLTLNLSLKLGSLSFPQKIGEFKAYHNNELVGDLVPCKHGNEVGMYDIIRNQFFTSSNANNFEAGNFIGGGKDRLITGNALVKFVSNKASLQDIQGTSDWIIARLAERGWSFGYRLISANLTVDNTKCVSPMLDMIIDASMQNTLTIYHGTTSNYGSFSRFSATGQAMQYITESGENVMTVNVNSNASAKFRFTVGIDKIALSYVYDHTRGKFIFRGDEVIYNIISSYDINIPFNIYSNNLIAQELGQSKFKVLSQDAVRREIGVSKEEWNVTYLQGKLIDYELNDYPDLDFRSADGISFVFTSNVITAYRSPYFSISNPSASINNGFASTFFGLWWWDGYLRVGRMSAYTKTLRSGGYAFTRRGTHFVITYNFKTGECKYYCNGVLNLTNTAPSDYSEQDLRTELATYPHLYLCGPSNTVNWKTNGIAVFGHVLDATDVADLFGNGNMSIKDTLLQDNWTASKLHPITVTNWGLYFNAGSGTALSGGGYEVLPSGTSGSKVITFGFNGIQETLLNNVNYEWDFEVTSGSCVHNASDRTSRTMIYQSTYFKCFTIYDEQGNDVTYETLTIGNYHVFCKPDNVYARGINASSYQLVYYFIGCTDDFSMEIKPSLKLTERGSALYCTTKNYKGDYWELANGLKMPISDVSIYNSTNFVRRNDIYIEDTVKYVSNVPPQFNGQMAVDSTNGKVYVGYLTGTGGTWKQINNS